MTGKGYKSDTVNRCSTFHKQTIYYYRVTTYNYRTITGLYHRTKAITTRMLPAIDSKEQKAFEKRDQELAKLAEKVGPLFKKWNEEKAKIKDFKKWNLSKELLETQNKLRKLARGNEELVYGRTKQILEWPDKKSADPELFYNGNHDKYMFNRTKDWFTKTMEFNVHEVAYSFANTWDMAELNATILVPKRLKVNDPVAVMFFLHGGGFVSKPQL